MLQHAQAKRAQNVVRGVYCAIHQLNSDTRSVPILYAFHYGVKLHFILKRCRLLSNNGGISAFVDGKVAVRRESAGVWIKGVVIRLAS